MPIIDRNVDVPGGELDLIALDGTRLVAIEVRTTTGKGDPIDAIDVAKRRRVRHLAAAVGASRMDLVGIALGSEALVVHWVPG
jgi:putative endonuclease